MIKFLALEVNDDYVSITYAAEPEFLSPNDPASVVTTVSTVTVPVSSVSWFSELEDDVADTIGFLGETTTFTLDDVQETPDDDEDQDYMEVL